VDGLDRSAKNSTKHIMKPQSNILFVALASLTLVFISTGYSASLLISNHSFEDPVTSAGTFITSNSSGPSGWDIYGPTASNRQFGVLNPAMTTLYVGGMVPDGANIGVVFLLGTAGEGGLQQTLSNTLQLNTAYTLTVEVGNIANDPNPPHSSFNFTGFPGYRIDLMAGGSVLASDNNGLSISDGAYATSTVSFTTGLSHLNSGENLRIRLVNLNGSGIEVNFDDVRLDAVAVPEPSSALLLGLGVLFYVGIRHRINMPNPKDSFE
jgi:hapalindole H/12-epi-hapalindole U/12-epi-fischerindole U synthase